MLWRNLLGTTLVSLVVWSCTGTDTVDTGPDDTGVVDPGEPVVVVQGDFWLRPGETTTYTASTTNHDTETYAWSSSNIAVLTIDEAGLATAVGLGDAVITATGATSGASATLGVVVTQDVPHLDEWAASAHADRTAEAFNHWNEDGEVPTSCAGCHTGTGFVDRIGGDGTAFNTVETAHATGQVIDCETCHHPAANDLDRVVFPSGAEVDGLGGEARCLTCHQGRASTDSVDTKIATAGVDDDTVSDKLSFQNIHYYAAGATLYAAEARGGYQYEGQVYDWKFRHVEGIDTCTGCHDPHSLQVRTEVCSDCHEGVTDVESLRSIRMMASALSDYDGDGNLAEGLAAEIDGLRAKLIQGIGAYTGEVTSSAACYDSGSYPYWFIDTDGNGSCSASEAAFDNAYKSWTPRLVRAAYNYQVSLKDPGAYAHNGKYLIQLLHDSIADLNTAITAKVDLSTAQRNDPGHFNGAGEPARHWDENETVSASCSKCHAGQEGLTFYLDYGIGSQSVRPDNGLECGTCHENIPGWELRIPDSLTFPSGVTLTDIADDEKLCGTCHSGREARSTIDATIAGGRYSFRNVHYLPGAATRFGAEAKVGYEYDGQTYAGPPSGHIGGDRCTDCHNPVETGHTFRVKDNLEACQTCHVSALQASDIRGSRHTLDYDGDGNTTEGLAAELEGLRAVTYAAFQTAASSGGGAICYDEHSYPYWFKDTNGNGSCEGDEATSSNGYKAWTPALMKAAHNLQIHSKDPGAWAHNFDYMAQLLIDSAQDLGADTSTLKRP